MTVLQRLSRGIYELYHEKRREVFSGKRDQKPVYCQPVDHGAGQSSDGSDSREICCLADRQERENKAKKRSGLKQAGAFFECTVPCRGNMPLRRKGFSAA